MTTQIPESDQIKQFKEFLGTYNKLTETCFLDCVKDFTTREVKPEEEFRLPFMFHCLEELKQPPTHGIEFNSTKFNMTVTLCQTTCSEHCLQKYLKMTQRISMRFQEYHIQQNEALAAKAGLLGQPR
ncbi:Mitochondrial import inner membrane translocase subunit Tim9 [Saguinus oedipus]|uniref:Mitochondrial import inner membrane translocase subunit n=1 Tax=Saguinus oedipus TaxID=9490 RepID=A0ABQ9TFS9_SAGOE|nr:Mitochondrial import inner membrane translocase subunit Tim9 [Saguinus oedipus]